MKTSLKASKIKNEQPIEYQEINEIKYLVLKRDYSKIEAGGVAMTEKCPFCGRTHMHTGAIAGHRMAQCRKNVTCTADDGSILNSSNGYILVNINKKIRE